MWRYVRPCAAASIIVVTVAIVAIGGAVRRLRLLLLRWWRLAIVAVAGAVGCGVTLMRRAWCRCLLSVMMVRRCWRVIEAIGRTWRAGILSHEVSLVLERIPLKQLILINLPHSPRVWCHRCRCCRHSEQVGDSSWVWEAVPA